MELSQLAMTRIELVKTVTLEGRLLCVGWSGGKDSTACLILAIEGYRKAHLAAKTNDTPILPLFVISTDTLIENPAVQAYHERMKAYVSAYALEHNLDIRLESPKPSLANSFAVKVIGGRALPTWANSTIRDCSQDYKITPARRFFRELPSTLMSELDAQTHHLLKAKPVVILGTRFGESIGRDIRMNERTDEAGVIQESGDAPEATWPLIADFELADVWELLALSGHDEDRPLAGFAPNFDETVSIYRDAQGGECVIVSGEKNQGASCGSRFGCWACCVAGSQDRSMEGMISDPRYAYMQGLSDLRNYLVNSRYDYKKRRWFGRKVEPLTGHIRILPDTLHPEECKALLQYCLTLDIREKERASSLANEVKAFASREDIPLKDHYLRSLVESGKGLDQDYIAQMTKPQFQIITLDALTAIDFMWSRYSYHRPFEAWRVAFDICEEGNRYNVPVLVSPQKISMPAPRWLDACEHVELGAGLYNSTYDLVGECMDKDHHVSLKSGDRVPPFEEEPSFDVAPEALSYFLDFDLGEIVNKSRKHHATYAADFYLRRSIIILAKGKMAATNQIVKHSQLLRDLDLQYGLSGACPIGTISDNEHNKRKEASRPNSKIVEQEKIKPLQVSFDFLNDAA